MQEFNVLVLAPQAYGTSFHFTDFIVALLTQIYWFVDVFGTLLSVVIAIFLYWLKLKLDKRNAARILLMEIRNAENTISAIRDSGAVAETTFVMPVSSWKKFQHYFVKDFDSDELDSVNRFYNLCILIQKEINRMKDQLPISNEEKIKITQHKLLDLAEKSNGDMEKFSADKKVILEECFFPETQWFEPALPKSRILQHLSNIKSILTTSSGQKLKSIA